MKRIYLADASRFISSSLRRPLCNGVAIMNFETMPELRWEYGYYMALGLIATSIGVAFWLFKRNDWL
jgi:hypothetical protein